MSSSLNNLLATLSPYAYPSKLEASITRANLVTREQEKEAQQKTVAAVPEATKEKAATLRFSDISKVKATIDPSAEALLFQRKSERVIKEDTTLERTFVRDARGEFFAASQGEANVSLASRQLRQFAEAENRQETPQKAFSNVSALYDAQTQYPIFKEKNLVDIAA